MDKAIKYQQILCEVLQEYGGIERNLTPDVKRQVIIDNERKHYQLLSTGWHNNKFIYL